MQRVNTLETRHIQEENRHISLFSSFLYFSLDICGKIPNKSVSVHIFQKNKEYVYMLFLQSRVTRRKMFPFIQNSSFLGTF